MLAVAIKLMADRACSERDLRRRLEKEFVELTDLDKRIDESIARLRELHLINDNRLAESIAQRYSHKGNRFIAQTLRQKGIPDEVITTVIGCKSTFVPFKGSRLFYERETREKISIWTLHSTWTH